MNDSTVMEVYDSKAKIFEAAAAHFVALAKEAIAERNRFTVALSGGSTPKGLFAQLAKNHAQDLDWTKVLFFWSDERTVPPEHADSNFRMASEALLVPLEIDAGQVFRMRGEDDPSAAALEYESALAELFAISTSDGPPSLDLILLGIGDDGHTASLFPHTEALREKSRWVVANHVPKLDTWRLTMTAGLINAAHEVAVLTAGSNKAEAVHGILQGPQRPNDLPCQLVKPVTGTVRWYLDRDAAGKS